MEMSEVFHIGDDKCLRCSGRGKARLFAGTAMRIHNHLALRRGRFYIWDDRLIETVEKRINLKKRTK